MVRLVLLAAALSAQHALATSSCLSSDPSCSGDADEAALLQRTVSQHVQNVSRGSCTATPAPTCGNAGINCYWDQVCNDNSGGACCNAGGAGVACKYCGDTGSSGCNQPCPEACETGLPDRCTNPKFTCPTNSHCQHASGYCVCTAGHCVNNGICEPTTTTTTSRSQERAPVVILDQQLRDHWGYTSSWHSGETDEWGYTDPCDKTSGLSWHAELPYVNGITLKCLDSTSCHDQFKPKDKGGFRHINFKIYVPPSHGTCSGDLFGQALSESLMVQLFGKEKVYHSMPSPLNRASQIKKSDAGMYWICWDIPHMQQDPMHGEWAQISVQNWPMNQEGHQGSFEIYLDYVSLADTCYTD